MDTPAESSQPPKPHRTSTILNWVLRGVTAVVIVGAAWLIYSYALSPPAIRHPTQAHYHFRLQIIDNGTVVNLADAKYQTPFNKDQCSALITKEPFHLHDNLDQFIHVHWAHVTGGLLLKHYGWNFIGGPDDTLGYKFNHLPHLEQVPIHGKILPTPSHKAKFYIYTGNQTSYRERNWNDFLTTDLRDFFAASAASASPASSASTSWWDRLIPTALAHGDETHAATPASAETMSEAPSKATSEAKLTQLNDVLGSVVIFAQNDRPSDAQIKDRFNHLVPLPASSCGG